MPELAGYNTVIKISGEPTSFTSEATTTSDDQVYQISDESKQVLDLETAPTVYDAGTETTEEYTVNYLNGKITFETVDDTRDITVDGKYLPMSTAAYARNMSKSNVADIYDSSVFGDEYKKRTAGQLSASGTINQIDVTDSTYEDALKNDEIVVIEIRDTSTAEPDRYFALLESSEIDAAIGGLSSESVSWVSYDKWIRKGE